MHNQLIKLVYQGFDLDQIATMLATDKGVLVKQVNEWRNSQSW